MSARGGLGRSFPIMGGLMVGTGGLSGFPVKQGGHDTVGPG